jgi:hypothetical protein
VIISWVVLQLMKSPIGVTLEGNMLLITSQYFRKGTALNSIVLLKLETLQVHFLPILNNKTLN